MCGRGSPGDPRSEEKEGDDGGELQGGPFPQGYHPDGVRWYVAYPLSYRHIEELMEECGVEVDHSLEWGL